MLALTLAQLDMAGWFGANAYLHARTAAAASAWPAAPDAKALASLGSPCKASMN